MPEREPAAPRPRPPRTDGGLAQLCTFRIGGEDYAIDIMRVREIIPPLPVTPVPRAPPFVEGVVRLRGDVIPVLDVRRRLGLPVTPPTRKTKYLIVNVAGRRLGLVVDEVSEVVRIPRAEIRPAPALVEAERAALLPGGLRRRGRRRGDGRRAPTAPAPAPAQREGAPRPGRTRRAGGGPGRGGGHEALMNVARDPGDPARPGPRDRGGGPLPGGRGARRRPRRASGSCSWRCSTTRAGGCGARRWSGWSPPARWPTSCRRCWRALGRRRASGGRDAAAVALVRIGAPAVVPLLAAAGRPGPRSPPGGRPRAGCHRRPAERGPAGGAAGRSRPQRAGGGRRGAGEGRRRRRPAPPCWRPSTRTSRRCGSRPWSRSWPCGSARPRPGSPRSWRTGPCGCPASGCSGTATSRRRPRCWRAASPSPRGAPARRRWRASGAQRARRRRPSWAGWRRRCGARPARAGVEACARGARGRGRCRWPSAPWRCSAGPARSARWRPCCGWPRTTGCARWWRRRSSACPGSARSERRWRPPWRSRAPSAASRPWGCWPRLGSPAALESLVREASDPSGYLQAEAIAALGQLGDSRAVGPLVGLLGDDVPAVSGIAATALVRIGQASRRRRAPRRSSRCATGPAPAPPPRSSASWGRSAGPRTCRGSGSGCAGAAVVQRMAAAGAVASLAQRGLVGRRRRPGAGRGALRRRLVGAGGGGARLRRAGAARAARPGAALRRRGASASAGGGARR